MKPRWTPILLAAALALGGYLALVDSRGRDGGAGARPAFRFQPERVRRLSLRSDELTLACERTGAAWRLLEPVEAPADPGAVARWMESLRRLEQSRLITAEERRERNLTWNDYGLHNPRAVLQIAGDSFLRTLEIGRDAPVGNSLYLRLDRSDEILAVSREFLDYLPKSANDIRSKRLLHADPEDVVRFSLQTADGFLQLQKRETGAWILQQPMAARADSGKVGDLVRSLCGVRIAEFVADGPDETAAYEGDDAVSELTLSHGDPAETVHIRFDAPGDEAAGLRTVRDLSRHAVYAVSNRALGFLQIDPASLLSDSLLPRQLAPPDRIVIRDGERLLEISREGESWALTKPRLWPAEKGRVQEFLDRLYGLRIQRYVSLTSSNLAAAGLAGDDLSVQLLRDRVTEGGSPVGDILASLAVGSRGEDGRRLSVRLLSESWIYEVDSALREALCVDPLTWRDRTLIALPADRIRGLTLRRTAPAVEAAMSTSDSAGDGSGRALRALSDLRAVRLVEADPADLSPYGLDEPTAALTIDLDPDFGVSKTLLLGEATDGGVYAMIRGQDLVAVVSERDVERLAGWAAEGIEPAAAEDGSP